MGRKVHPIGMRLGINQPWQGRWFAEGKTYREQLHQDFAIRHSADWAVRPKAARRPIRMRIELRTDLPEMVLNGKAGIARIDVERFPGKMRIALHTAKPGILIGRKGEGVKKIRVALEALVGKKIDLDVKEIESPDTDATLVATQRCRSVGAPYRLSPCNEACHSTGHASGCQGHQDHGRWSPGRCRNVA